MFLSWSIEEDDAEHDEDEGEEALNADHHLHQQLALEEGETDVPLLEEERPLGAVAHPIEHVVKRNHVPIHLPSREGESSTWNLSILAFTKRMVMMKASVSSIAT